MKSMKKTLLSGLALAVVATTGFAGTANAAPNYQQSQQRDDHRNDNNFRNGAYEVNGHRYERQRGPAWHQPKNWQHHNWKRGQRLPVEYRRTVVSDYRNYHLAPPPRGYQYVRDGNDVVLTAIASGIIGAVIANVFVN